MACGVPVHNGGFFGSAQHKSISFFLIIQFFFGRKQLFFFIGQDMTG
jgi:hypothetical protein